MAVPELPTWLRDATGGCVLSVHARPGASQSRVQGVHGDALAVRLHARPVEGAANRELLAVLATALAVAPSSLEIVAGSSGREKRVRVHGIDARTALARLASRGIP